MTPWEISDGDCDIICKQIAAQCELNEDRSLHCLEWGSGGSTIAFPKFLRTQRMDFNWVSVEHSFEWYHKVVTALADHSLAGLAHVRLERCDGDAHTEPMDSYVDFPRTLRRRFNFVFVDGRKRRRCLKVASQLLAPGGMVILHDAEREHYWPAFDDYKMHRRLGDKLWLGQVDL